MEMIKCRFCDRSFANSRALGGHVRTHMAKLEVASVQEDIVSAGSESLSNEEKDPLCYGLRENPKRSLKLADPEFSLVGQVQVLDKDSEVESGKNPVRRRSNRFREVNGVDADEPAAKRVKPVEFTKPVGFVRDPERGSSVSDTTTEEDAACWLMMMKQGKWVYDEVSEEEDDEAEVEEDYDSDESMKLKKAKSKYKCETCRKVFKSYQALGGHRASHKKFRNVNDINGNQSIVEKADNEGKVHECPICLRVFLSGQALGGHKRSHFVGSSSSVVVVAPIEEIENKERALFDLNLPAPVEDCDAYSQVELSAISEADFGINSVRH